VDTEYRRVDFEDGSGVAYAFIAYAGPWAEARLRWTEVAIDDNTLDEEGRRFADHVAEAFSWNESDWVKYETEVGGDVSAVVEASAADMFGWDFVFYAARCGMECGAGGPLAGDPTAGSKDAGG